MNKETYNNIRLGIFVISGTFLFIIGMYFVGSNKNMFGKTFRLYADFYNVNGLQYGNNVRFSGIDVGTIGKINILNDTSIRVEMLIDFHLKKFIHKNSIASIGTDGLMGNKLVNIEPGDSVSPLAEEGDELRTMRTVDTEKMLRTLEFTNDNVSTISDDLRSITSTINRSKGTLYTVLMDTTLAHGLHRTLENIEEISLHLHDLSSEASELVNGVKEGRGVIGSLLADSSVVSRDFHQTIGNLEASSRRLADLVTDMQSVVNKLNTGNGTFSTVLNDSAVSNHLKRSMANIDSSAYNFNENMKALQGNIFFRKYFKQKQKKNK